ncbi:hypothetical protein NA57DRAFT_67903 [Rhizodiscina lignyota]|uniref:DUF7729 domain-containing protein n=1 Tax=Rhizodiscina lignyota TaxID=1504668 RepID=A0A9P4I9T7_9PEZI|nr:hypothetical protein NA57DRAFT_67903 [Rhizodiscina lignyota]
MRLARRDEASIPSFSIADVSTSKPASSTSRGNATTTTTTSSSTATQTGSPTNSPLPQPFDTNLGNNFTSTCPQFFNSFLKNSTFQNCVPFSLLLQTSQAFFQASKSLVRITQVLDASCDVSFNTCNSIMSDLAVQLKDPNNCGTDFTNNNPIVLQAYDGFIAYQPMFQAACQKDKKGTYCFADAITNTSSAADSYPYYLPLNIELPGGARPTCDTCLQETMSIFANAASNASQPISNTYKDAAQQINIGCGPDFVNSTISVRTGGASAMDGMVAFAPIITLFVALFTLLF